MTSTSTERLPSQVVAFRDARWKTRWLLVALAFLLLWRSTGFVSREWLSQIPPWVWLVVMALGFEAFLLLFPIITRNPRRRGTFRIPALKRCLIEFGIAVPVVIVTLILLAAVDHLVGRIWPGTSLTPDAVKKMATYPPSIFVYSMLLVSFTIAPVAEEVFFRGFLHNAFRVRMPWIIASVAQCLIFGFIHLYGLLHCCVLCFVGLVLTLLYEWRKTLVTPILVHAGWNLLAALGVVLLMVDHANGPVLGVIGDEKDTACVIRDTVSGSPAEEAGLQAGDVITAVEGVPIADFQQLIETIGLYRPGDTVRVRIERDGLPYKAGVVLQRRGALPVP